MARRHFLTAAVPLGLLAVASCSPAAPVPSGGGSSRSNGRRSPARLQARPGTPTAPGAGAAPAAGTHPLGLVASRDTLLHVPPGLDAAQPVPLVVTLHGAGGDAEGGFGLLRPLADERGFLVLAPSSRASTWDAIRGGYGPDVELLDRALEQVFASWTVDPERIAVAGFSDGASYALGLGLANGDLFRRIVAFSPGFVPPAPVTGEPAVFVSHGDADQVLPISRTSRRIVPALQDMGYDVTYEEFAGPHVVPADVARAAVDWLGWPA